MSGTATLSPATSSKLARATTGLRSALPYATGVLSLAFNAVVLWPVIGRLTRPEETGQLAAGLAVVTMAAPLMTGGLHVLLLRETAEAADERAPEARALGSVAVVSGLVMGLAALAAWAMVGAGWLAVLFLGVSTGLSLVVIAVARGLARPWVFTVAVVGAQTLALVVAGAVLSAVRSTEAALVASGCCIVLVSVYGARAMGCLAWSPGAFKALGDGLRESVVLIPHLILAVGILQGVRLLVAWSQGFVAAAHVQFALLLGGLPITCVVALNGYWSVDALRRSGTGQPADATLRYSRRLVVSALVLVVVTGGMTMSCLSSWLPAGYPVADISRTVAFMTPGAVFQALADVQSTRALKSRRLGVMSASTALGAVVTLSVVLLGGGDLGIAAAGLGVSAGLAVRYVAGVLLLRRHRDLLGTSRHELWGALAAVALAGVAIVATS